MSSKNGVSPAFARDADDALRIQLEASVFDRARDAAHPLHLAMPVGAVVAFVDLHAIAAAVLGRVTGDVGGGQHRGGAGGVARDAHHADARAHRQAVGAPQEAIAVNGLADAVGDALRLLQRAALQQQAEFVAAQARDGVRGAHPRLQQAGDVAQQPVAGAVAAGVVDHLELVEVDVQQHVFAFAALRGGHRGFEPRVELAPVDEPGERVVARLVGQRALQAPFLGDVAEHDDRADGRALAVADRRRGFLDREFLAAAIHQHVVIGGHRGLAGDAARDRACRPRACAWIRR